ncbi:MAG: CehA/McbA family metallohydrolase [Prosthecobacter sp.]|nr:CehA/McbA family metallohydrolase [Prosthecobacter sp.]
MAAAHDLSWPLFQALQNRAEMQMIASGVSLSALAAPLPEGAPVCKVKLRLLDAATGQPRAGLVRVLRADGTALPLSGLISHGTALPRNHPARAWHAILHEGTLTLPREAWRIEAIGGLETEMAALALDLRDKEKAEASLPLTRFADAAAQGWRAGNTHLHLRYLSRGQAEQYLRTLPRADGLEMMFVSYLERAKEDARYISNQFTAEQIRALSGEGVTFGWGQEMRHNLGAGGEGYGHVMLLNLRALVQPVSIGAGITGAGHDFPPLRPGLEKARAQGSSVLWCHNAFGFEDVPSWLAGLIHAQNIFDGGSVGSYAQSFYRYLDIGLRVPFSTGTDWFIYDFARVYARPEGTLTEQSWLDALAKGRSFISNGPLLDFTVNEAHIGDTLDVTQARQLVLKGRATGRHDFQRIEVIHNGEVIAQAASRKVGGHFEADLTHTLIADAPGWLALRLPSRSAPVQENDPRNECGEVIFAHTSPIYLAKNGQLRHDPAAAQSLLEDLAKARIEIEAKCKFADDAQKAEVIRIYKVAEAFLHRENPATK